MDAPALLLRDPTATARETTDACDALFGMLGGEHNRAEDDDARRRAGALGLGVALARALARSVRGETGEGADVEARLAVAGLRLVRQLARDRGQLEPLVLAGVGEAVLDTMRVFPGTDAELEGLRALLNLAAAPTNLDALCAQGAHRVVCDVLRAANDEHADASDLLTRLGCEVLARLGQSPAAKPLVFAEGGFDAVVDALQLHGNLASVTEKALTALAVLSSDDANAERVAERGEVHLLLVQQARLHARDARVQEWACRAVCSVSRAPANRTRLVGASAPQAVADAMRTHAPTDDAVAAFGCAAMRALAHRSSETKLVLVKAYGAAALVVLALKSHPAALPVAYHGCAAVWCLAGEADNKPALVQRGADAAVVGALRACPDSPHVAAHALAALACLANHAPAKAPLVQQLGAGELVVQAMVRFASSATAVALHGAAALWSMALLRENKRVLVEAGAPGAVLDALSLYSGDARTALKLLGCLVSLTIGVAPERADEAVARGAVQVLLVALKRHEAEPAVLERCVAALANLASAATDKAQFNAARLNERALDFKTAFPDRPAMEREVERLLDALGGEVLV